MVTKCTRKFQLRLFLALAMLLLLFVTPFHSFGQISKPNIRTQRLLLQLASCYLNVAKQAQIDIDSGLVLAGRRSRLNRMIVIGETFDDILVDPANKWIANEDIYSAKQLASFSRGKKRSSLLNFIGYFYAFQPGSRKHDLDSALVYLKMSKEEAEANGDTKSILQSLCGMGKCYLEREEPLLARSIFNQAVNEAIKAGDKEQEAIAWANWGTYSPFKPNTIIERINQLKKALALYENLDNKESQVNVLSNIGYLSFAAGKINDSKQAFLQALSIERVIKFPFTHYTTDLLAMIAGAEGDHESELRYALDVVKTAEATKDSIALAYFYSRRANTELFSAKNNGEAFEWSQKALVEFKRLGGDPSLYESAHMVASFYIQLGKSQKAVDLIQDILKHYSPESPISSQNVYLTLGEAYEHLENFAAAERYFLAAEKLQHDAMKIRGDIGIFTVYFKIGEFYFRNKQYEKSRKYLDTALLYPETNYDFNHFVDIQNFLSVIDSAAGNLRGALMHARKYDVLRDSARAYAGRKQVDELRIQYETEKKENNIRLLQQQAALQTATINQDKRIKKVMIGSAVLLVLFLALLYNRYYLKQKSNKQLKSQQLEISEKNTSLQHLLEEKEWLIKEVHHRVKNNLQIMISLLNTQSRYLESDAAIKAIHESQERMHAISLIHQKLYKSEDTAFINIREYVHELAEHIRSGFSGTSNIMFELNISNTQMDVAHAVPLGLILNEAISNTIKYAFTGSNPGLVNITLKHSVENDEYVLTVSDNGVGLPPGYDVSRKASFGIRLMEGLSKQLLGTFKIVSNNGVRIEVAFKDSNVFKSSQSQMAERFSHSLS